MKIRVLIKKPNDDVEEVELENDYKKIQKIVGGLFDIILLPTDESVDIYCNDEGLLMGLDPNIALPEHKSVLVGTIMFASYDEEGRTVGLNDEQIESVRNYLKDKDVGGLDLRSAYLRCLSLNKKSVCCVCGREFTGYGNNPHPLRDSGVCCDECNQLAIIERIKALGPH